MFSNRSTRVEILFAVIRVISGFNTIIIEANGSFSIALTRKPRLHADVNQHPLKSMRNAFTKSMKQKAGTF